MLSTWLNYIYYIFIIFLFYELDSHSPMVFSISKSYFQLDFWFGWKSVSIGKYFFILQEGTVEFCRSTLTWVDTKVRGPIENI